MRLLFTLLPLCSFLLHHGVSGVDPDEVFVMEGDSVTLNTGVKKTQKDRIRWYNNDTRIADINGDQSKICTDVQCNEGTERFRGRLKLDHQTGSLTIRNITNTDSGDYKLLISSGRNDIEKIFRVSVSAAQKEMERKTVKEGESLTLDPGVTKTTTGSMMWRFNKTLTLAEITGDQSKICTDDQCDERFRDRLKLDHQTGSLTITNTRITDSGLYKLQISSDSSRRRRRSISISGVKSFEVSVTADPGSGLSPADPGSGLSSGAVAGIVVAVLLGFVAAASAVIYYRHRSSRNDGEKQSPHDLNIPDPSKELMGEPENELKHDEVP